MTQHDRGGLLPITIEAQTGENEKSGSSFIPKHFPEYNKGGGEDARKGEKREQGLVQEPTKRRVHR